MTIELNDNHDCNNFQIESNGHVVCRACGLELPASKVFDCHMRDPVKNRNRVIQTPLVSTLFHVTTTILPDFVKKPIHGRLLTDDERTMIRAMDMVNDICRILMLPKHMSERALYVARKIVRYNKHVFKTTTPVAAAAGLYISFREHGYNFASLSMINLFKSMKHQVSLSKLLQVVGYYSKVVNYNRPRHSGMAIYLNRFKTSIEFRAAYNAKAYGVPFGVFMKRVVSKYESLKEAQLKRLGAINGGHAILVCRAISSVEKEVMQENNMSIKKTNHFTIPCLMAMITPKEDMVVK